MNTEKDYKPALLAAGKLASAALIVLENTNPIFLSNRLQLLKDRLADYDKEILKLEKDD